MWSLNGAPKNALKPVPTFGAFVNRGGQSSEVAVLQKREGWPNGRYLGRTRNHLIGTERVAFELSRPTIIAGDDF